MYDFIEVYEDALDGAICDQMIEKFEASSERHKPGVSSSGVDTSRKDSTDMCISAYKDWQEMTNEVIKTTTRCLVDYVRKHSHLLFGLQGNKIRNPLTGQFETITHELVEAQPPSILENLIKTCFRPAPLTLLKYTKGSGGYHKWHSEIGPTTTDCEALHRVLFFIIYLNDVQEGGETSIYYYDRMIKSRRGRMVIAPAGFTHTHKGNIPVSNEKYIVASWIMFRRYEDMARTYGIPR